MKPIALQLFLLLSVGAAFAQTPATSPHQPKNANLTTFAGIAPSANIQSLLAAADYSAARTLLGLVIGTNVQAYSANLTTFAAIAPSANVQTLLAAADYASFRAALITAELGLVNGMETLVLQADGTIQFADNTNGGYLHLQAPDLSAGGEFDINLPAVDGTVVTTGNLSAITATGTITTGTWTGTAIAMLNGGTGATTAAYARTNLGLVIGTHVQAYSANLTTFAGIAPSANVQSLLGAADYSTSLLVGIATSAVGQTTEQIDAIFAVAAAATTS